MQEGIDYLKQDNCFRWIADPERAQTPADAQLRADGPGLFNGWTQTYFPVLQNMPAPNPLDYYWSADETEWATDIMFRNTTALDRLFPMLARHGLIVSDSASVMRYLGRIAAEAALPRRLAGDGRGDRRRRHEGLCVKHRVGRNSVKIYNKAGNVLRTETTLNDPRAFKVFRQPNDDTTPAPGWLPMRKGVADLKLLRFLAQGQWAVEGLRNRDLARWLDPHAEELSSVDRRKLAARASRVLLILRAHGLIRRAQKTHRYLVTPKGLRVAALMISTATVQAEELMRKAA